jgi:glycopeptide antibiotics resistance protein
LAKWADINFNVRTGVPFVLLGILGGQLNKTAFTLKLVTSWGIAFLVIGLAAETGQLLLPSRHFDWADVFWGVAGGFVGLGISLSFTMLWNQRDNKSKENQPNRQSSS